jgi:cobyrinic acid a,c-diamide synthase
VFDLHTAMTDRLTLGYRDAVATVDSPLAEIGARVPGHEFHRTRVVTPAPAPNAWKWSARGAAVADGYVRGNVHASYLHTHWSGTPGLAERFVATARRHDRAVSR